LPIKHGSYRECQRYLCKDCDRAFNNKTGTTLAHAKIGLDKQLLAFFSFLRFNTSIRQLEAEIGLSYRLLRWHVEQFARSLGAPVINLVGPVEIGEFYASAGKKDRERYLDRDRMPSQNTDEERMRDINRQYSDLSIALAVSNTLFQRNGHRTALSETMRVACI